jgi:hypothetical protein
MTWKKWLILIVGVSAIVVLLLIGRQVSYLGGLMAFTPLTISFSTVETPRPDGAPCLGGDSSPGIAKEIMNAETRTIYVAGGANPISDEAWASLRLSLPWIQNSTRHLMFDGSCFFRSPGVPANCQGDACFLSEEHFGTTWFLLNTVEGQSCYPDASGCMGTRVNPGFVSTTTISKCHEVVFNGPAIYELSDGRGNRYVMHATENGTPTIEGVQLPEGWALELRTIDEPLRLLPFGGGNSCYYNIIRDNLVQSYHQFAFAGDTFPEPQS